MTDAPERIWRDDVALAMIAAWVNCPPDKLPPEMRAHTCEATAVAWGRVADVARAMAATARNAALEEAARAADERDAGWMRKTYQIEHNRKRYDVPGVERCENKFANILSEDIAAAIRALKTPAE